MPEERTSSRKSSSRGNPEETERKLEEAGRMRPDDQRILEKDGKGTMTVEEAGHLGGEIGGQKVKKLIQEGKEYEREAGKPSESRSQRR